MRAALRPLVALLPIVLLTAPASAARFAGSGHFLVGTPQQQFAAFAPTGYGFQAAGVANLDPQGWLGIRLDGGWLYFGGVEHDVPFSGTGGLVNVRLHTSNNLAMLGIGPQFSVPTGPIRPYVYATAGLGYFFTTSSVTNQNTGEEIAGSTNFSSTVFAWSTGVGFQMPVARSIAIDAGAEYRSQKDAEYLAKDNIVQNPDGTPGGIRGSHRTDADLVSYHLGVTFTSPF